MASRIFVSFNFKDKEVVFTVKSMLQKGGGNIQGKFAFVENDVSAEGVRAIDEEIKRIMKLCDAALFVIGDNNHNSSWIEREAELAKSMNLKIVVTRLPHTRGAVPPGLRSGQYPEVEWSSTDLGRVLNNS